MSTPIINEEAGADRADLLDAKGLNGIRLVIVTLHPAVNPTEARLAVHFHTTHELASILADITDPVNPRKPADIFPITGGYRIVAGSASDNVQVTSVSGIPALKVLTLTVGPIGDYSTYTLSVEYKNMDPLFSEVDFKFRPGCFSANCRPDWEPAPVPRSGPPIDYLAKDYDSFRHTMMTAMTERVPGWQPSSEADLDQVIIDLLSAAADELSDYQDRVMNEAFLSTARKRVSLARHSRLMDYHVHQGSQASTWLALTVEDLASFKLPKGFKVWTGTEGAEKSTAVFVTQQKQFVDSLLNSMGLYTWSGAIPALRAGSTQADLKLSTPDKVSADAIQNAIRSGAVRHLLIQERLNPATGKEPGRDPQKRQILRLLPGVRGAESLQDPVTTEWLVRVRWEEEDRLTYSYCFTVSCPDGTVEDVSAFHGNLVMGYHGYPVVETFKEAGDLLGVADEYYYERTERWGTLCRLRKGPLAYKTTPAGGEIPPESTIGVTVKTPSGSDSWNEVISLIHSREDDDHFIVETDEEMKSLIRFGNGTNGRELPDKAEVTCRFQVGAGPDGNVGADSLVSFNAGFFNHVLTCWNPFDVTDGRPPEPWAEIIRRVPEAYRYRQARAVTLKDYEERAIQIPGVSQAVASYAWTGSWRTVRITIDPAGTQTLGDELRRTIESHLNAVKLIGEDLEIRPPRFVPLEITVTLCVHPDYWPLDIVSILEQEFSEGFTPDGRRAFFHPDEWTFGQALWPSEIIGRVQAIRGVDHVVSVTMKRMHEATPGTGEFIEVRHNEIIQVKNDPDHQELGTITFDPKGGRR